MHAEPIEGVILLRSGASPQRAAESRIRDELRMTGLRVDEVRDPRDDAEVTHIMAEHGALTAVRLESSGDAYDLVILVSENEVSGEVRAHRMNTLLIDSAVVALKAAEAVRYQMLELRANRSPPKVQSSPEILPGPSNANDPGVAQLLVPIPPVQVVPLPRPELGGVAPDLPRLLALRKDVAMRTDADGGPATRTPSLASARTRWRGAGERWIGASMAVAGGPGGGRSLVGAICSLGWRLLPALSVKAELGALTSPVPIPLSEGATRLGLATAQFLTLLGPPRPRRLAPHLRLGGGPALAWATGASGPPRGQADLAVVGILTAGAGLVVRVHPRLRLAAGVDVQILVPPTGLRLNGAPELRVGPPLLRGMLGLEFTLSPGRRPTKEHEPIRPAPATSRS